MLGRSDTAIRAAVGTDNPIVDAEPGIGDAGLVVTLGEAGIQNLLDVGLAIAVGVLHEQDIGRAGHDQAAFPRHDATHG